MRVIETPEAYFYAVVVPNCQDFATSPNDVRLAMNAAIATFHMRDWMYKSHGGTDLSRVHGATTIGQYQNALESSCTEFGILSDLANASKHMELDERVRKRARVLNRAADLQEDGMRAGDPVGYSLSLIRVNLVDGSSAIFKWVLDCSLALWCRELLLTCSEIEAVSRRVGINQRLTSADHQSCHGTALERQRGRTGIDAKE